MTVSVASRYRILAIVIVSLATISFHYGWIVKPAGGESELFHAIHGRLCYIPIILGAIWFSIWGGLAVAVGISLLTLPYSFTGHAAHAGQLTGELTEIVFYLAIGLTAGVLIEMQRKERARREALSRELVRQEHLSSLGQMAAGLAHEIKNPLGSIRGSAEILGDDYPAGSRKHEILQVLSKETNRLNSVVEDFLNFARPRPLSRTETDINRVLEDLIAQIEVDTRTKNIRIEKDFDPSIPPAPFDGDKLHQAFLNISLNAVAAMPDGGRLLVETRLKTHEGTPHVDVRFADEGVGIDPGDLDKIFDPFFTTNEKGTGLGLSISHMIVQHHGGHISAGNNGGRGTSFTVSLPIVEE